MRVNWPLKYFAHLSLYMSRMWAGFVSKVLKIGAFYILRLQKTSETHQLNVKSMPFSKLLGNESAHIGNSAFQITGCRKQKHRQRVQEIRCFFNLNAMQSIHQFRNDRSTLWIYIYKCHSLFFYLKECSIAANCTKMIAEIYTHDSTWTPSKKMAVDSAYHSVCHKYRF